MTRSVAFLAVLLVPVSLGGQALSSLSQGVRQYVSVSEPVVALTHVRVVDGTGAAPFEDATIVIENGRIAQVGAAAQVRVPAGARVLDLSGHTVIPGIVGMHDHTHYATLRRNMQLSFSAPRLYLANGVTTVRTAGSHAPYVDINLKRSIDRGQTPGPRMHITGPYLNGPGGQVGLAVGMAEVDTPEGARRLVAYWADEGVTWVKAYSSIGREPLRAAIDEAHKRGLKVTGHLCSVSFREAVALGIDNLEHGLFTNSDWAPDKVPDQCPPNLMTRLPNVAINGPEVQQTIREMVSHKVALTSTLAVYEQFYPDRPPLDDRVLEALAPEALQEYLAARKEISLNTATSTMPQMFRLAQEFERAFVRAGGLLAAGADPTGLGGSVQGFSDQRNYELLIEAEFKPVEAVQILSLNGAKILGVDDRLGSITPGKIADLSVIRGNPLVNPREIRNVTLVFKDGVGYDSAKLLASVRGLVGIR